MKLKKWLAVLLAVLLLFPLTACGKKKTTSEKTSTATSTSKTARTDAPGIDPGNLYNYTSGIASNDTCEVSEPTVSGDTAVNVPWSGGRRTTAVPRSTAAARAAAPPPSFARGRE